MSESPSPNGPQSGRDSHGRFSKGNPGGPGNPFAAEVGKRRSRLMKAIRNEDITQAVSVMRQVMATGKDTDRLMAARLLLDRAIGPTLPADVIERIEKLEAALKGERK
jgi:hypothetical protein